MAIFSHFSAKNGTTFTGKCLLRSLPDSESRVILEVEEEGAQASRMRFQFLKEGVLRAADDGAASNVSPLPLPGVSIVAFDTNRFAYPVELQCSAEQAAHSLSQTEYLLGKYLNDFSIDKRSFEIIASL